MKHQLSVLLGKDILRVLNSACSQVLDYGEKADKADTAMYCIPESEEQRLYSQITSYGVKDVPSTDIT